MTSFYTKLSGQYIGIVAMCAMSIAHADTVSDALIANRPDQARAALLAQLPKPELRIATLGQLGKVEFQAANYEKAIEYLQQAVAGDPALASNHFMLGKAYCQNAQQVSMISAFGQAKKCVASLEQANKLDPRSVPTLLALVGFHAEAPSVAGGSPEKLVRFTTDLKRLAPMNATMVDIKALQKEKKQDKATQVARELKQQKGLPINVQYPLALYFKEQKMFAEAEEVLESLIVMPVGDQTSLEDRWFVNDASLQLGEVFLATKRHLSRAVTLVKDSQVKNNNPKDNHYFWSYWTLAKLYKAGGNQDKYNAEVARIKSMDYRWHKSFAKQFDAETRN